MIAGGLMTGEDNEGFDSPPGRMIYTSISGGQTSAYLAAEFPTRHNVFALIRVQDPKLKFPDPVLRARVEDKLQMPFIGTVEDDTIITTVFDLEQYLGKEITWVSGITFEEVILEKGRRLPNKIQRFCTTEMKLQPIFHWWYKTLHPVPVDCQIGFRAGEERRAFNKLQKVNDYGLETIKATVRKLPDGRNKWEYFDWQRPVFPLVDNGIYRDDVVEYWRGKPVKFAWRNNCVGCFHRSAMLLKKVSDIYPKKYEWFASQERNHRRNATWRADTTYDKIKQHNTQHELEFSDFSDCDSGYCGV